MALEERACTCLSFGSLDAELGGEDLSADIVVGGDPETRTQLQVASSGGHSRRYQQASGKVRWEGKAAGKGISFSTEAPTVGI